MKINVATYNIQHCRDYVRSMNSDNEIIDVEKFCETINGFGADVCGLNEVYNQEMLDGGVNQAKAIGDSLGFYSYFAKAIEYHGYEYGNAIVSRFPIVSAKTVPLVLPDGMRKKPHYEDRALLVAELDADGKRFTVMICHFGLTPEEQEFATSIVLAEIENVKSPLVFMGDLNVRPESEIISKLRGALCDVSLLKNCEKPTFDSVNPERKIDYIFTNESVDVIETEIPSVVCSDHLPVTAKIEI